MTTDDQHQKAPLLIGLGIFLAFWLLFAWFVADFISASQTRGLIQNESAAVDAQADNIAHNIDINLDHLHGIPSLVAKNEGVLAALTQRGAASLPSSLSAEQRKKTWSEDSRLIAIDSFLGLVGASLGADVVWVTDAAGDCVASSNVDKADSFVGTNYADRDYFRMAQAGKLGRQYAMGRKSDIPGLYFSAPITLDGRFAGVAVAKIDLPNLAHWVNQSDAFISDEFGIIILSRDKALEMRSLPNAAIAGLSREKRLARYKLADFLPLTINPWDNPRFSNLRHFGHESQALLLTSRQVKNEGIDVHAFKRLPEAADFDRKRWTLFLSIAVAGTLILFAFGVHRVYARIRKHAELRMAESASLLRAAIESTADGILVIDNNRHITTHNQRFADMWRVPPELLAAGQDAALLNFVLDQLEDPQHFMGKVMELYAHPENTSYDTIQFKDERIFERYSFPQRLGARVVGRVWSFRDITGHKQAEQKLAESQLQLQTIIENEPECVKLMSADGSVLQMNRAGLDMIGADTVEQVIGQRVLEIIEPAYRADFMALTRRVFEGESGNLEFEICGFKGAHRWLDTHAVPLRDTQGKITALLGVTRDITGRKLIEQALRNSRDELEEKVLERTADLQAANAALLVEKTHQEALITKLEEAQNQLLQSEKLASIGQLAAGVAHEINNPVGFVNSNLGTLQQYMNDLLRLLAAYEGIEGALTDEARGNLEQLKQEIDAAYLREDVGKLLSESMDGLRRVKRIVLDLKDFSHVDETEKQWANLEQGMESTLNVVWNELKYKTEVVKEYGEIPEIECIPSQLNQVFMNLLMNAAHAIEERGKITIRTGQDEGSVWVEVEDTGKGIAPEHLTRIFEPFFTTKPVGQGTGLGLSLSYGIVQKHGGRIEVKSELGKGTVFRVVLPQSLDSGNTLLETT